MVVTENGREVLASGHKATLPNDEIKQQKSEITQESNNNDINISV